MCARYKLITPTGVIIENFSVRTGRPNLDARYNIAPSQLAPVVRLGPSGRQLAMLRWGLIPSWARDSKVSFSTINARAETVAEKPAFRDALEQRRCLVIADGYYEWESRADGKQPHLYSRADGRLMAFAGLWERWGQGATTIESFTIIVTDGNQLVREVHDRMPVILDEDDFESWLDVDECRPPDVLPLLRPYRAENMRVEAVSRRINNARSEGPEVLLPEAQASLFS